MTAGRVVEFELPKPTILLNPLLRMHWAKRSKVARALAWDVRVAAGGQIPPAPFARAEVLIERHSTGVPDTDGAVGGAKLLVDVLLACSRTHPLGLGFIVDDSPAHLILRVASVRVARADLQKTRVVIQELLE